MGPRLRGDDAEADLALRDKLHSQQARP